MFCVAVVAASALGASPASAGPKEIRQYLKATVPKGVGGTAVVARDGKLVSCTGFGLSDQARKIPAGCDTVYDTMSITKQFTAVAILKLEMMGRLSTRDRLTRFFASVPENKRRITLHHLLTHSAGLVEGLGDDYQVMSRTAMINAAMKSRPRSRPGAKFHYSNLGYSLLAAVVEKASGMSYEGFLHKYVFAPAHMSQTGYVIPRWKRDRIAVEYDKRGRSRGTPLDHPWASDGPYWNLRGNGGMLSTARDMFRYHRALEGTRLLNTAAKRKLFKPQISEGKVPELRTEIFYAYGWDILRLPPHGRIATHDGGNDWSLGRYTRLLDQRVMVFWISNNAYRTARWNLEDLDRSLTLGLAQRA